MKKVMLYLMMGIFMISLASGFEFDNVKQYDEETKTVTIKNSLLGIDWLSYGEVAEITLDTPLNNILPPGYHKVAQFTITSNSNYNNYMKELELFDVREGMKSINKNIDLKYLTYEEVDTYTSLCNEQTAANGSKITLCENVKTGTKQVEKWEELNHSILNEDEVITIGLFTHVIQGERVEWIPTLFGVRIEEWASWTGDSLAGIVSCWTLDEVSGTVIDYGPGQLNNGTNNGGTPNVPSQTSSLGKAYLLGDGTNTINISDSTSLNQTGNFSLGIVFNTTTDSDALVGKGLAIEDSGYWMFSNPTFSVDQSDGDPTLVSGTQEVTTGNDVLMIGTYYAGTQVEIFINGTSRGTSNTNIEASALSSGVEFLIGGISDNTFDGDVYVSEVWLLNYSVVAADVSTIWNSGDIISCLNPAPIVTLNSPEDASQTLNFLNTFNSTATSELEMKNMTLYTNITGSWGVSNTTIFNSTTVNDTIPGTWAGQGSGITETTGIKIVANEDRTITNVTKGVVSGQAATLAYLLDSDQNELTSASFIGNDAFINYEVEEGEIYYIVTDNDGSLYNYRQEVSTELPINLDKFNITKGFIGGTETSIRPKAIRHINSTGINGTSPVTRNWNLTLSLPSTTLWNVEACDEDDVCAFAPDNFTLDVTSVLENSQTFNASAFETNTQSFFANITTNGTAPSSAKLIYNGTTYTATVTNTAGDDYNLSRSIDIPTGISNKTFFFNVTLNNIESSTSSNKQLINVTNFTHCTSGTPFVNVTFRNETASLENVTATIASTWNYWLGTGTTFKTLTFNDAAENLNYTFCLEDITQTLNTNTTIVYGNSISQSRSFFSTPILTDTTTQIVLYLLPDTLGLFQQFSTIDNLGNVVKNVQATIRRTIGGVPTIISSGITDDSGFISFFLDPTTSNDATFAKTGFDNNLFSFFPSTTARSVIMGGLATTNFTGSNISLGTEYFILPTNQSLNNNTNVTFSFNVSSNETIIFISMNITNGTNTQYLFVSNAGQGFISGIINTSSNTTFRGEFIIQTSNETITIQKIWIVGQTFVGDYSLFRQGKLFNDYGFSDFIRLLIVLITIVGMLILMTSTEVTDSSETKIGVAVLLIWAFSIIGWLDTGLSTASPLSEFSSQYGIAILATCVGMFFILRRTFIRRI